MLWFSTVLSTNTTRTSKNASACPFTHLLLFRLFVCSLILRHSVKCWFLTVFQKWEETLKEYLVQCLKSVWKSDNVRNNVLRETNNQASTGTSRVTLSVETSKRTSQTFHCWLMQTWLGTRAVKPLKNATPRTSLWNCYSSRNVWSMGTYRSHFPRLGGPTAPPFVLNADEGNGR